MCVAEVRGVDLKVRVITQSMSSTPIALQSMLSCSHSSPGTAKVEGTSGTLMHSIVNAG